MTKGNVALVAACLFAASGCKSLVPYRPDREVVRSIPSALARDALRDLLVRATAYPYSGTLEQIDVGETELGFVFTDQGSLFLPEVQASFRYDELDPHVYAYEGGAARDPFVVRMIGPIEKTIGINAHYGCLWFPGESREDAEKLVDALSSLRTAAGGAATGGGGAVPLAVESREVVCPECGTGLPGTTRFCGKDGTSLALAVKCPVCDRGYPAGTLFCQDDGEALQGR